MDFSHYTDDPVTLAVELVNTLQPLTHTDSLGTVEDLDRFVHAHAGAWVDDLPPAAPSDLAPAKALRSELRAVFDSAGAQEATEVINGILARHVAVPRVSTHGGGAHLHFEPKAASLAQWLGVVTGMGLATVVCEFGLDRLGLCQSETCADAFVDTSRNRSRRHCSTTCSTRENVAAYRARRRQEA